MRNAKAGDFWRAVYKGKYSIKLAKFSYNNLVGLGDGSIEFSGGITIICGGNGVGKSTLLNAIRSCLATDRSPKHWLTRLVGSQLEASIEVRNNTSTIILGADDFSSVIEEQSDNIETTTLELDSSSDKSVLDDVPTSSESTAGFNVLYLDLASQSAQLILHYSTLKNFDEILEGLSPGEANDQDLETLSYLVGKDYSQCFTYEIEEFGDEMLRPYFRVTASGSEYGSESMGVGEMALHLIYWHLKRVPEETVLLLEEPETHISPRSQGAIMNVLAKFSAEKKLWTICTTHSPAIVARIPKQHIKLLSRMGTSVQVITSPKQAQLDLVFAVSTKVSGVFFVEDGAACAFLQNWLELSAPDLLGVFEIVKTTSESEIQEALKRFPRVGPWLKVVGIFDGDMRGRLKTKFNWPHAFLPGTKSPEGLVRKAVLENPGRLAQQLGRDLEDIKLILSQVEGYDVHDWYDELRKALKVTYHQLMRYSFSVWHEVEDNSKIAMDALSALTKALYANPNPVYRLRRRKGRPRKPTKK